MNYNINNNNNRLATKNNNAVLAMRHITTKGIDCDDVYDEISKIYFSDENTNRIQKMIKQQVFEKSKGKFRLEEDQDENALLITMRAIFLENARFLPNKIIHQVKELNKKTLDYLIPNIMTEIKQLYSYIKEINEPIKTIPRPMNVNNAGRRTLPALTSTWE
jgi:hypothetical protein